MMATDECLEDELMVDEYVDCTGRLRRFRLAVYAGGRFLRAVELRDRDEPGLHVSLPTGADGVPPWGRMRELLRARLARRDLASDPRSGRLEILTNVVHAQVGFATEEDGGPPLFIDDLELSWVDLGRLLASYEGWHLRIEIKDLTEALG
jgi:hypothetical protein